MALLDKIHKTINYANHFGGKLTLKQLHWRLLTDKKHSITEIKKIVLKNKIKLNNTNNLENNKKVKLAKELVDKHLIKFANILMVGITGSVVAENAKKDDDIDLFVICKSDTLWLTRLLLRIYVKINKIPHRKWGQKEKANEFCFNLWLDENNLVISKPKQNQKNAVDLIMMKVMLDKDNIYKKFVGQNDWAAKFVANGYNQISDNRYSITDNKKENSIIIKYLNYLAFVGQIIYIRLKGPVKFINLRQAFFHK